MTSTIDRRSFLKTAAALAAAGPLAAAEKGAVFPIVDTHQHLWDLRKFTLAWQKEHPSLAKNFLMEDYVKVNDELARVGKETPAKVVRTVYMEVDVLPEQQQAEVNYVTAICKGGGTPMVAAVVSGRPASDGFAKYIAQFKENKYIKGVRQVIHNKDIPAGYCLDKKFITGIQRLGEHGLSFDICIRAAELPDAGKLVDACPDTRFILDHCGNADVQAKDRSQWKRDITDLAKRKNLICKVSGIIASAVPGKWTPDDLAPIVNHVLDSFGPERVIFAGDWPVCTLTASLAQWIEALRTIVRERPAGEQKKLFHDNAVRFYGLT
jgi:predicted TIM-barrel fold metal-dependent hydrolase